MDAYWVHGFPFCAECVESDPSCLFPEEKKNATRAPGANRCACCRREFDLVREPTIRERILDPLLSRTFLYRNLESGSVEHQTVLRAVSRCPVSPQRWRILADFYEENPVATGLVGQLAASKFGSLPDEYRAIAILLEQSEEWWTTKHDSYWTTLLMEFMPGGDA